MAKNTKNSSFFMWLIGAIFVGYLLGDEAPQSDVDNFPLSSQSSSSSELNQQKLERSIVSSENKSKPKPVSTEHFMYVDASRLNVRSGPTKSNKVIWTVKRNEKVRVFDKSGDWLRIKNNDYDGWVYGSFLTPKLSLEVTKMQEIRQSKISTAEIKKILIQRSHAYYSGNCPCPYNTTSAGRSCGKRSAYSRPGGASPLCYPSDVTSGMVADYRARN